MRRMKLCLATMRSICLSSGVMKRAPRGSLATLTKPGQRLPEPHNAEARPSRIIVGPSIMRSV
jgi:hypothetical protein